jgi:hypothetical protein
MKAVVVILSFLLFGYRYVVFLWIVFSVSTIHNTTRYDGYITLLLTNGSIASLDVCTPLTDPVKLRKDNC